MKKTLVDAPDVTKRALFGVGWYDAYWYDDRPSRMSLRPARLARRFGDMIAAARLRHSEAPAPATLQHHGQDLVAAGER
jgi:hypothetical protein